MIFCIFNPSRLPNFLLIICTLHVPKFTPAISFKKRRFYLSKESMALNKVYIIEFIYCHAPLLKIRENGVATRVGDVYIREENTTRIHAKPN